MQRRSNNMLMWAILFISLASIFIVSEVSAFQRHVIRCEVGSIGSGFQKKVIRVIKYCINRDYKTSFYNMRWLEKRYLKKIFGEINQEIYELVIILNGVDENYINNSLRSDGEFYDFHMKIINENVGRLSHLLGQFGVEPLTDDCMKLRSVDGCYAQAQKKMALPKLRKIKTNIFFLGLQ